MTSQLVRGPTVSGGVCASERFLFAQDTEACDLLLRPGVVDAKPWLGVPTRACSALLRRVESSMRVGLFGPWHDYIIAPLSISGQDCRPVEEMSDSWRCVLFHRPGWLGCWVCKDEP